MYRYRKDTHAVEIHFINFIQINCVAYDDFGPVDSSAALGMTGVKVQEIVMKRSPAAEPSKQFSGMTNMVLFAEDWMQEADVIRFMHDFGIAGDFGLWRF